MARVKIAYEEDAKKTSQNTSLLNLQDVALRLSSEDSVVVATVPLVAGDTIRTSTGSTFKISHNILEGHRFAIEPIASGQPLLSWGYPFGRACTDISPGDYLANDAMLESLVKHGIDKFLLPLKANFVDEINVYQLEQFEECDQLPRDSEIHTFDGYARAGGRGVGTRNYIMVLGTSAASKPFVNKLEKIFQNEKRYPGIDGIVFVAHTEGVRKNANNYLQTLRVLAGYVVHCNCGGVLLVDLGPEYEAISIDELLSECDLRLPGWRKYLPFRTHRLTGNFKVDVELCKENITNNLIPIVSKFVRTKQPLSNLLLAQQCGGSDAFSGVSANPIIGNVAKRIIQQGGCAVLAESDELIGAESHILSKCSSRQTAEKFLRTIQRFKNRMTTYGQSAEQNPSGGNNLRGIYNITLKSIGAGMKKEKSVRLDYVLCYGEHIGPDR
jgi:altronate dehydratase